MLKRNRSGNCARPKSSSSACASTATVSGVAPMAFQAQTACGDAAASVGFSAPNCSQPSNVPVEVGSLLDDDDCSSSGDAQPVKRRRRCVTVLRKIFRNYSHFFLYGVIEESNGDLLPAMEKILALEEQRSKSEPASLMPGHDDPNLYLSYHSMYDIHANPYESNAIGASRYYPKALYYMNSFPTPQDPMEPRGTLGMYAPSTSALESPMMGMYAPPTAGTSSCGSEWNTWFPP